MIPPSRAFRTTETNSLNICRGQCIEEGSRCQSFALGINAKSGGNGTCQLSSERVFENAGRRPRNTVYDPNFNLYQRKENCGTNDNNDMPSKLEGKVMLLFECVHFSSVGFNECCFFSIVGMPTMGTMETEMPSDHPSMPTTGTTNTNGAITSSSSYSDRMPTAQTSADASTTNDMTMSSMNTMSTNPSLSEKPGTMPTDNTQGNPSSTSNSHTMTTTNVYSNTVDITKMPNPPTMMSTTNTMDRFPSTAMTYGGGSSTDLSTNEVKPPTYPSTSIYVSDAKPDDFSYPYPPHFHNKYNYYHEVYPIYTYPSYYESSYSDGGYAPNTPTVGYPMQIDQYGTTPTMSGYGAVGSTSSTGGGGSSGSSSNRPAYMGNGWSNVDQSDRRKQGERYPDRDQNSGSYPEGKYNGTRANATVPYIRTYFNPDLYLKDGKREYTYANDGFVGIVMCDDHLHDKSNVEPPPSRCMQS